MEDWKERPVKEQQELKERLAKLVSFINSEKFYQLSKNNRQLLLNQKIAMELYLSVLNMRLFEDIDKVTIPDYSLIQAMSGMFGKPWGNQPDSYKPWEQFNKPLIPEETIENK